MSTDQPDGGDTGRGGRTPRVGDSRSPVGSTLSIVLAIVAVIAGFLILRTLRDDDGDGETSPIVSENTAGPDETDGSDDPGATTTTPRPATSTTAPLVRVGATIAVANASGVDGSALQMSTALEAAEYEGVGEPGNGTGEDIAASVVYYVNGNAAAQQVANSIARELRVAAAQPMPEERPASDGGTATATVLVLLGGDQAGQPIPGAQAQTTPPQVGTTTT